MFMEKWHIVVIKTTVMTYELARLSLVKQPFLEPLDVAYNHVYKI